MMPKTGTDAVFNCMNVATVFAPKKVYGRPDLEAFNCVLKFRFAATTRTRANIGDQCHATHGKAAGLACLVN